MLSGGDIDKKPPELLREVGSQREVLNKITAEVDSVLVMHKCPRPRIVDAAKILEQMKKPRKCTADSISFTEEARQYRRAAQVKDALRGAPQAERRHGEGDQVGQLSRAVWRRRRASRSASLVP